MLARIVSAFFFRDMRIAVSYRFAFIFDLSTILFSTATFYFVAKLFGSAQIPSLQPYGGNYFSFVLIGLAFSTYQSIGLTAFAQSIRQEQYMGTLEALLVTRVPIGHLLISSAAWDFLYASLQILVYFGVGIFVFGMVMSNVQFLSAIVFLILTLTAFMSFGILAAAFILRFKRGNPVTWLLVTLSELLGGVFFPVEILPPWLQKLAQFLPMSHALWGLRGALLTGQTLQELSLHAYALAGFTVVFLPMGIFLFNRALRSAQKDGSLGQY